MKYKMMPVIWVGDLEEALKAQYGEEFIKEIRQDHNGIRRLMFDEFFMNDVCCQYSFDELEEYTGDTWQNEAHIRLENCIKTFLQDTFPGHTSIIVDVMW